METYGNPTFQASIHQIVIENDNEFNRGIMETRSIEHHTSIVKCLMDCIPLDKQERMSASSNNFVKRKLKYFAAVRNCQMIVFFDRLGHLEVPWLPPSFPQI